jgi:hypothetical protein
LVQFGGTPLKNLAQQFPTFREARQGELRTGPVSVFGRDYQGNYAPLIGEDGKLTGALFVGVPK